MTNLFRGVAVALPTPFFKNEVDTESVEKMIERQIRANTDAIVLLGTTGEAPVLSTEEKRAIVRAAVRARNDAAKRAGKSIVPLIVGCGSNDTKLAVRYAALAAEEGADALLAVTPYYNECTQKGLLSYYEAITKAVPLPFLAYSVPARTGVKILPETARRLADLPNFAGIKSAEGDMAQILRTLRFLRGKADVYCGDDLLNFPVFAVGGAGTISVAANLAPRLVKSQYLAVTRGDRKKAEKINDLLLPLITECFRTVNPIPVKAAMSFVGCPCGSPRAPLTPLNGYRKRKISRMIERLKIEAKNEKLTDGNDL